MIKYKYWHYIKNFGRYKALYKRHKKYTMIGEKTFAENLYLIDYWLRKQDLYHGCIVECGTWLGGTSFAMIDLCPRIEEFHCFDSFQGLPQAGPLDGEDARRLQEQGALVAVNNLASIEEFREGLDRFEPKTRQKVHVHGGWFKDTLPGFRPERPIAVLRLDCDWYDSVTLALDTLFDQVAPNGLIVIDDYFTWDGCARAVHDFLSRRQARERIQQTWLGRVFYIVKDYPPVREEERRHLAAADR